MLELEPSPLCTIPCVSRQENTTASRKRKRFEPLRSPILLLSFMTAALRSTPARPTRRLDRADSCDSTPARKSVKMTIVECDEGPRPTRSINLSRGRTLYSALEVDKSLLSHASSRILRAPLRGFSKRIRGGAGWQDGGTLLRLAQPLEVRK